MEENKVTHRGRAIKTNKDENFVYPSQTTKSDRRISNVTVEKQVDTKETEQMAKETNSAMPQQHTISTSTADYTLSAAKILDKKIEACDRTPVKAKHTTQNSVLSFSTSAFEMLKKYTSKYFSANDFTVKLSQKQDAAGLIESDILRIQERDNLQVTVNFYRTTSRVLVNGAGLLRFRSVHFPEILKSILSEYDQTEEADLKEGLRQLTTLYEESGTEETPRKQPASALEGKSPTADGSLDCLDRDHDLSTPHNTPTPYPISTQNELTESIVKTSESPKVPYTNENHMVHTNEITPSVSFPEELHAVEAPTRSSIENLTPRGTDDSLEGKHQEPEPEPKPQTKPDIKNRSRPITAVESGPASDVQEVIQALQEGISEMITAQNKRNDGLQQQHWGKERERLQNTIKERDLQIADLHKTHEKHLQEKEKAMRFLEKQIAAKDKELSQRPAVSQHKADHRECEERFAELTTQSSSDQLEIERLQ